MRSPDPRAAELAPLVLLRPRLERWRAAVDEIAQGVLVRAADRFDPTVVVSGVRRGLEHRLASWLGRAVTVDLHRARDAGRLVGETAVQRFEAFLEALGDPAFGDEFWRRYPVLAEAIDADLERASRRARGLCEHLAEDARAIADHFELLGPLARLETDLGDPHDGGRTVCRLDFADRGSVFYKPRSVAPERAFYGLVERLDRAGFRPRLATPKVLERVDALGERGYMAAVSPAPCLDAAAAERYFERVGGWLALARLVGLTDLHHGNLIAAGEQPIWIDLETMFHPRLDVGDPIDRDTILRTGLFPAEIGAGGGAAGLDGAAGRATRVLRLDAPGTDRQRWVWREETPPPSEHGARSADGAPLVASRFVASVEAGFRRAWEWIARADPADLLDPFESLTVRVVPRPTRIYSRLLQAAWHPSLLTAPEARSELFDRLALDLPNRPYLESLLDAERRALERADVPRFHTRSDSRDLVGEGQVVPDFLAETGLDAARRRLAAWRPRVLEREVWTLRRALWSPSADRRWAEPFAARRTRRTEPATTAEWAIDLAIDAGDRLADLAFGSPSDAAGVDWSELAQTGPTTWAWQRLGASLYGGLAGVAVAFAQLAAVTGFGRFEAMARAADRRAVALLGSPDSPADVGLPGPGAFTGWGGVIYGQLLLASLWREPERIDWMVDLASKVDQFDRVDAAVHADWVGGTAGWIAVLLRLRGMALGSSLDWSLLDAARRAGDRSLASAIETDGGITWPSAEVDGRPLAGLAHGTSGIAWALAELARATGEDRYRDAALAAAAWERQRFDAANGEWPDLRPPSGEASTRPPMTAWCHGSPGIAVARGAMLDALDPRDEAPVPQCRELRQDLDRALDATLARGSADDASDSLCHGQLGNLLILSRGLGLDDPRRARIDALSASCLDGLERRGFRPGAPAGLDPPGLMTGQAGLIHGLLRLGAPDRVASILHLELPVQAALDRSDPISAPPGRGQGDLNTASNPEDFR